MKKNVLFSPLFLYNLALITHDATKSVNPSIKIASPSLHRPLGNYNNNNNNNINFIKTKYNS